MEQTVLLGRGKQILEVSEEEWKQHLTHIPQHGQSRLNFMSEEHRQVRYFVVEELITHQKPVQPESISRILNLPLEQVNQLLDELESRLFFLVRGESGAVNWAYPVTVDTTAHQLTFNSGDQIYGA